jgi:cullin 3
MLMDLGRQTYAEDFEAHFLAAAADFYRKEAQGWIAACSAPEYLAKVG